MGKFANDPEVIAAYPPADVTVERIGDPHSYELSNLRAVLPAQAALAGEDKNFNS